MEIQWQDKKAGGRRPVSEYALKMRSRKQGGKHLFTIGYPAISKMSFAKGDKFAVGAGNNNGRDFTAIKRVASGGYTLSIHNGSKCGHISITMDSPQPEGTWAMEDVEFHDDGLIILYHDLVKPLDGAK